MIEVMATLWPDMPHWKYFSMHPNLDGIRLNTAMAETKGLLPLLQEAVDYSTVPLYFDVKGRQLRITKVYPCGGDHLELDLNHPIQVETPALVLFKGGVDECLLLKAEGNHLVFQGGPKFNLLPGESLTIRSASLQVLGPTFTEQQLEFLDIAKKAGVRRYMLSYATSDEEIEELRSLLGDNVDELVAKIENIKGLQWARSAPTHCYGVRHNYLTARGDLFVELPRPHDILWATREILKADPNAILGSRMLLSLSTDPLPSCADLNELAWLLEIGYKRFMFCDSLCLDRDALDRAITILKTVASNPNYGVTNEIFSIPENHRASTPI